jgi:hypothetical protein
MIINACEPGQIKSPLHANGLHTSILSSSPNLRNPTFSLPSEGASEVV